MSALLLLSLGLFAVVALLTALQPLLSKKTTDTTTFDPDATQREQLESELDALTTQLSQLNDEQQRPALENRAARLLRELDALPPPPARAPRALLLGGVLAALLLVGAGAYSFIPRWQLAALDTQEGQAVQKALALPELHRAALASNSAESYLKWADAAFAAGAYPQATQGYAESLKLSTRQPRALRRLGMLLISGQSGRSVDQKEALQAFMLVRTAAQLAPNDPESQLYLGLALNNFGEDKLALAALERYQQLAPQAHDADDILATLRAKTGQATHADSIFASSCASCHGASGRGSSGPDLHASRLSRAELSQVITQGKNGMPAFANLAPTDLNQLLDKLEQWQK